MDQDNMVLLSVNKITRYILHTPLHCKNSSLCYASLRLLWLVLIRLQPSGFDTIQDCRVTVHMTSYTNKYCVAHMMVFYVIHSTLLKKFILQLLPVHCISWTDISSISYSGSFNAVDENGALCIQVFSSTLQPKWARIAGAFSSSLLLVSAAQVAEYSGSWLDQNSNYLPVGTLSYIPGILFVWVDVLSEDVIQKWYKDGHSVRGKMLFLD